MSMMRKRWAIAGAFPLIAAVAPVGGGWTQPVAEIEEIVVTGSRIRRDPLSESAPLMAIGADALERTGLTNLGDALQALPITGSAPNSQFNVPGNSGFPQDGAGIGAGSVQVSLRNVGSKRTLVLVDGRRWIAGASASGVPGHVDLNSIPDNVIDRVEILQDGASAIYGSDAIGGVVNIITDRGFSGFRADLQSGGYLGAGDGESTEASLKWGAGNGRTHLVLSAGYRDEGGIETADRSRSAFPNPNATSCDVPNTLCSSFTPQGRFVFGPNFAGGASVTLNTGALNDGGANIPDFDPANPHAGDFHPFTAADRFNYNGPGFNYLRTPNERINAFASARHEISAGTELFATVSYTNRSSATKGAPEPLCLGAGCGNRINDRFFISAANPYNPFGVDLSAVDGTLAFFGHRPLESGPRLFFQDVDTLFGTLGAGGELFSLPVGEAGVAAGIEYRDHDGSFRPDPVAARGETAGIPSGPTDGRFDVVEYYGELSLPMISNGVRYWELNLAARNSDYSTFGSELTYKINTLYRPVEQFSLRGSLSTGFRAPRIGELFGGAAREDFLFLDPCADVLGQFGSANGGRDTSQPSTVIANCAALGVPTSLVQTNPQLSAISAGSPSLNAEHRRHRGIRTRRNARLYQSRMAYGPDQRDAECHVPCGLYRAHRQHRWNRNHHGTRRNSHRRDVSTSVSQAAMDNHGGLVEESLGRGGEFPLDRRNDAGRRRTGGLRCVHRPSPDLQSVRRRRRLDDFAGLQQPLR